MQRFNKKPNYKKRQYVGNSIIYEFPYKRKNYPNYLEKAKSCFNYLQNIEWDSPDRLTITTEPFHVKGLSRMTTDDFSFTCPESIFANNPELRVPGPWYISINSIDTDYDNMNLFSDLFNEEPRMKANVIGKISPFEFWTRNGRRVMEAARLEYDTENPSNYQVREKIYEIYEGPRLINFDKFFCDICLSFVKKF